jgi:hypothetical protein
MLCLADQSMSPGFRRITISAIHHIASRDVPMLALRGERLKTIGFSVGAKAFLSSIKRGDITLTRMGLVRPRFVKAKP